MTVRYITVTPQANFFKPATRAFGDIAIVGGAAATATGPKKVAVPITNPDSVSYTATTTLTTAAAAAVIGSVMGAAIAAVAGTMVVLYYGVIDPFIGFLAGIKAFTAAVLGGIGSLPGAMLGGLLIGLIEAFWSGYFSTEYKDVSVFVILVLVLIFRPTGLLGRPDVEKV